MHTGGTQHIEAYNICPFFTDPSSLPPAAPPRLGLQGLHHVHDPLALHDVLGHARPVRDQAVRDGRERHRKPRATGEKGDQRTCDRPADLRRTARSSAQFVGGESILESYGVEVVNLNLDSCKKLMSDFIAAKPEVWNEVRCGWDGGEGVGGEG